MRKHWLQPRWDKTGSWITSGLINPAADWRHWRIKESNTHDVSCALHRGRYHFLVWGSIKKQALDTANFAQWPTAVFWSTAAKVTRSWRWRRRRRTSLPALGARAAPERSIGALLWRQRHTTTSHPRTILATTLLWILFQRRRAPSRHFHCRISISVMLFYIHHWV